MNFPSADRLTLLALLTKVLTTLPSRMTKMRPPSVSEITTRVRPSALTTPLSMMPVSAGLSSQRDLPVRAFHAVTSMPPSSVINVSLSAARSNMLWRCGPTE